MSDRQIRAFLEAHSWGLLAMLHDARPYAVPVSYGLDGAHLYIASGAGRKLRSLQASPAVCLTIADVVSGANWSSVVVLAEQRPVRARRGRTRRPSARTTPALQPAPPPTAALVRQTARGARRGHTFRPPPAR